MKSGKVWGETRPIWQGNNVALHRIEIKKGGYSSRHVHEHKFNLFFVEAGRLEIRVWKKDYDLCDRTVLFSGEMTIVEPGEFHQFHAQADTVAFELYWTALRGDDIVREGHGGQRGED